MMKGLVEQLLQRFAARSAQSSQRVANEITRIGVQKTKELSFYVKLDDYNMRMIIIFA